MITLQMVIAILMTISVVFGMVSLCLEIKRLHNRAALLESEVDCYKNLLEFTQDERDTYRNLLNKALENQEQKP